jgi:hypothetical protein
MDRGSNKHGRLHDEELRHETEGLVRGGHPTHAEEWKDPEPPGDDQPDPGLVATSEQPGVPPGMTPGDVEGRSALARSLPPSAFPADAAALRRVAAESFAPQPVLDVLGRLPEGREYANVNEVWRALGGHVEEHRT